MLDNILLNQINYLISNSWINEDEKDSFFKNEELINAINSSTSPTKENIFNALKLIPFENTSVLILGQDPYPNPLDAHGLAFSSRNNVTPGSLKNIFIAIDKAYGSNLYAKQYNELTSWARQGVLLLNTSLTFEKISDNSLNKKDLQKLQQKNQVYHLKLWKPFVNHIIKKLLNTKNRPVVFFLWGDKAQKLVENNIKNTDISDNILILKSTHPSPLSVNRGGDFPELAPKHFKMCNEFLKNHGKKAILWNNLD